MALLDATCKGLTSASGQVKLDAALPTVKAQISQLTALINTAQQHCGSIKAGAVFAGGHTKVDLSNLLASLLIEVEASVNVAVGVFGQWRLYAVCSALDVSIKVFCSTIGGMFVGLLALIGGTLTFALHGSGAVLGGVMGLVSAHLHILK